MVLITGLLLYAGQLASLVHAADHPFHTEADTCTAFASFEQHNHAVAVLPWSNKHPQFTDEIIAGSPPVFVQNFTLTYHSRAPPLYT